MIEERNGSDTAIKQYVWGLNYIDEFVQIAVNHDLWNNPQMVDPHPWGVSPWSEPLSVKKYYALHDANYNVLGMVDHAGNLAERYEYTPYGERQVYTSSGLNDPACMTPTLLSQRQNMYAWTLGDPEELIAFPQPYGLNDIGHQGKAHDEAIGLIFGNARIRYPSFGTWLQRDPAGYIDGLNLYKFVKNRPINTLDPTGMQSLAPPCGRGKPGDVKGGACYHRTTRQRLGYTPLTNGCTGVPNGFYFGNTYVSFFGSCNTHDRCYGTCGRSQKSCDQDFYGDLVNACNLASLNYWNLFRCLTYARAYYWGVNSAGAPYYEQGQDNACEWEECCCRAGNKPTGRMP